MALSLLLFFAACFFVIFIVFIFKIVDGFYTFLFWGAIYVPTTEKRVEQMVRMLDLKSSKSAVDLGSGDGRLLIALAKKGIKATGYEVNPFLISLSRKNIKKSGLENMAVVFSKSLWRADLKDFDIVILYGMRHMMRRLKKKLQKELKPGSQIISNYFVFPNWKPDIADDNIYLYVKK